MSRRVPLPRLDQRRKTARWQRERRQQAIAVIVFGGILMFVLGLAAWAASDRYYTANLRPAAVIAGEAIPMRELEREKRFQLVRFYVEAQVPREFENDPRVEREKHQYEGLALEKLIERAALERFARQEGVAIDPAAIEERFAREHSQYSARHILIEPAKDAIDAQAADRAARAKAEEIARRLRAAPMDQELWNRTAEQESADPGSKDSGGELGFAAAGQFPKDFEDVAMRLPIGEISEPVRTQFGWHVFQVRERKGAESSELYQRYLSSGFTAADLRDRVRLQLLRDEVSRRVERPLLVSPTEQVRLLRITVNTPMPRGADFSAFIEGARKIGEVQKGVDEGRDFAEMARQLSDHPSGQQGGDVGWHARGMIADTRVEAEIFQLPPGTNTRPFATTTQTTFYRVVERDPSRALTDEQRRTISATVFDQWLSSQKQELGVRKLRPGFEFD